MKPEIAITNFGNNECLGMPNYKFDSDKRSLQIFPQIQIFLAKYPIIALLENQLAGSGRTVWENKWKYKNIS